MPYGCLLCKVYTEFWCHYLSVQCVETKKCQVYFIFGQSEFESFQKLKDILADSPILRFYNNHKKIFLCRDAFSVGIGTVLMHLAIWITESDVVWRVQCAYKHLASPQSNDIRWNIFNWLNIWKVPGFNRTVIWASTVTKYQLISQKRPQRVVVAALPVVVQPLVCGRRCPHRVLLKIRS